MSENIGMPSPQETESGPKRIDVNNGVKSTVEDLDNSYEEQTLNLGSKVPQVNEILLPRKEEALFDFADEEGRKAAEKRRVMLERKAAGAALAAKKRTEAAVRWKGKTEEERNEAREALKAWGDKPEEERKKDLKEWRGKTVEEKEREDNTDLAKVMEALAAEARKRDTTAARARARCGEKMRESKEFPMFVEGEKAGSVVVYSIEESAEVTNVNKRPHDDTNNNEPNTKDETGSKRKRSDVFNLLS